MSTLGLRELQDALHKKADSLQRDFIRISDELEDIGHKLLEAEEPDRPPLREKREALKAEQQELARGINLWRERARSVIQQRGAGSLRDFLDELKALDDPDLDPVLDRTIFMLEAPPEELEKMLVTAEEVRDLSPAGRLLQRARTEYDLRGGDPAPRQRAAVEFAARPGIPQQKGSIEELEAAFDDPDPIVREVAILAAIQVHRFLALNLADLVAAHRSVQRLTSIQHSATIPILVEIVQNPRTGFEEGESGPEEKYNDSSRMVALLRLVEWHTQEAQTAIQMRQFDRNQHISRAAKRALELFPGPWEGPLKAS